MAFSRDSLRAGAVKSATARTLLAPSPSTLPTRGDLAPRDAVLTGAASRESSATFPTTVAQRSGVTARVVVLSLGLAALFGYIVPILDFQLYSTKLGAGHLPVGAVGTLLVLLLIVNPLLRRLAHAGRWAFARNEMLTVYITCLFSTLAPGMGSESLFVSHTIGPFYFATRENGWLVFLEHNLPAWFTPALYPHGHYGNAQRHAIEGWYGGVGAVSWAMWLVPLLAWSALIFASYLMLGCLSIILRAQWGEHEALSFPLSRLALEMTSDTDRLDARHAMGSFFRNPLMWVGFGLAAFIEIVNGLSVYYPNVPSVPLTMNLGALFTEPPWNQMAPMALIIWPIFSGITYLLTAEVSFSLWFFLFFIQFQYIVAYYCGYSYGTLPAAIGHSSDGGARTFTAFQQVGGYLAYASVLLWTAREHLRHVARRALGRVHATPAERAEALSYPVAFWGFWGAFAFVVAWSCAAGMRVDVAVALWVLYLVTALVLSRAIVEGGVMFINQGWVPLGTLAQLTGSGAGTWLTTSSIVPASFFQVTFFQDMRGFLMPSFCYGLKLAHDEKINSRRLWPLILSSTLIAFGVGVWAKVRMGYSATGGGLALHPWFSTVAAKYPGQNSQSFIAGESHASATNWLWMGLGALFTFGLMTARARLAWFPLHPLGYMLALTAPTQRAWFSFFLGWLAKVTITRYGGPDTYRRLIPVALGLILGEVSMFIFWLLIDAWQGRIGHSLLP